MGFYRFGLLRWVYISLMGMSILALRTSTIATPDPLLKVSSPNLQIIITNLDKTTKAAAYKNLTPLNDSTQKESSTTQNQIMPLQSKKKTPRTTVLSKPSDFTVQPYGLLIANLKKTSKNIPSYGSAPKTTQNETNLPPEPLIPIGIGGARRRKTSESP